ncbi:MAG TPA: hypothetical protein VF407_00200, partial [Polyangiaceae bacterium]
MRALPARTRSFVSFAIGFVSLGSLGLFVACGGGDDSSSPSTDDAGSGTDATNATDTGTPNEAGADSGPSGGVTVKGKVVDNGGSPAPSAKLLVGGVLVTADANGVFEADHVSVPYDAVVRIDDPKRGPTITAFYGLTSTSPVITGFANGPTATADISGTMTGGKGFPQAAGVSYEIAAGGPDVESGGGTGGGANAAADFELTTSWPTSIRGESITLYAIQYATPTAVLAPPTTYYAAGTDFIGALDADAGRPNNTLPLTTITTTHTATVNVALPDGWAVGRYYFEIPVGATSFFFRSDVSTPTTSFVLPQLPFGAARISVAYSGPGGAYSVLRLADVGLGADATIPVAATDVPLPPTVTSPADNATGVDPTTPFTLAKTASGDVVYNLFITTTTPGAPMYVIYSNSGWMHLPDTTALGLTVASGASFS